LYKVSVLLSTDAALWTAYWSAVGRPDNRVEALKWWKNPGLMPEGASFDHFRIFAPLHVQQLVRDCGPPRDWLDGSLSRPG